MAGVYLRELRLIGKSKKDAAIILEKGVNIISGPSNTGKTFIFECIEYMLGRKKLDRRITESQGYQAILLELGTYDNRIFSLKSDFEGSDFHMYNSSLNEIDENTEFEILRRKHQPGKKDTLSNWILKKCALDGSLIRTNASGKKRELSLRDLRVLHIIDELRIPTKASPFLSGQHISVTAEENVLKLLLSGQDDSHIIETMPEKVLANKTGRIEVLSELIGIEKESLNSVPPKIDLTDQKKKLLNSIDGLKEERDKLFGIYQALLKEKQELISKSQINETKIAEKNKLLSNSVVLEKQYHSDINRLRSTIEVGGALMNIGNVNCPVCNSTIENDTSISVARIAESAFSELGKMNGMLNELMQVKELLQVELGEFFNCQSIIKEKLEFLSSKINEDVKGKLTKLCSTIETYQNQIFKLSEQISSYDRLDFLENQKSSISKIVENAPPKKREFEKVSTSSMEEISKKMEEFLKEWGYPDLERVVYSEEIKDFVISGEPRNLTGKGYRAITFSAFILSLVSCQKTETKRLGFCMIDSPLVTYKKPDVPSGEEISEDMSLSFFKSLAKLNKDSQVVIFENEDVPKEIENKINHIHFTKNPKFGRYGFIP